MTELEKKLDAMIDAKVGMSKIPEPYDTRAADVYAVALDLLARIAELEKEEQATKKVIGVLKAAAEADEARIAELEEDIFASNKVIEDNAKLVQEQLTTIRNQQARIAELEKNRELIADELIRRVIIEKRKEKIQEVIGRINRTHSVKELFNLLTELAQPALRDKENDDKIPVP